MTRRVEVGGENEVEGYIRIEVDDTSVTAAETSRDKWKVGASGSITSDGR
jgi:hypothetical protein